MFKEVTTSELGTYICRIFYGILILFLCLFQLLFLLNFFSDVFTEGNRVHLNPKLFGDTILGEILALILLFCGISFLIYWLFLLFLRLKRMSINEHGISCKNQFLDWRKVSKITAYGGHFRIIVIKFKENHHPKKLMGIIPFNLAKDFVNSLSSFTKKNGVNLTRWFI
jgi:hypothetical protein